MIKYKRLPELMSSKNSQIASLFQYKTQRIFYRGSTFVKKSNLFE